MTDLSENLKFDKETSTLTVVDVEGANFLIAGRVVHGEVKLTKNTTVRARPQPGRVFSRGAQTEWKFKVDSSEGSEESAKPADPVETRVSSGSGLRSVGTTPNPGPTGGTPQDS